MLLAWFGMIAIGIFSARYLKPGTPNTKIGGTHLWFHLHRGLNFTAVMIIIVLTTLIFIPKTAASPSSYINNLNSADTPLKTAIMIFRDEINSFNSTTSMNSSEIINKILQFIELSFGWNAEVKFKLCQLSNDPVLSPFLNFIQCDFNITSTAVFNTAPGLVVFPNQTNSIRNNNNTVCQPLKEGIPDHPSPTKPSKSTFFGLTDVTIDKVLEMIDSCRHLVNSTRPWIKNLICES
uniref:Cytochrome b561 domain-containing protein n=1 Tax=Panagrolaimus sp. ES5 TaxID=591445 RepID=A0AC34G3K8_9BILA